MNIRVRGADVVKKRRNRKQGQGIIIRKRRKRKKGGKERHLRGCTRGGGRRRAGKHLLLRAARAVLYIHTVLCAHRINRAFTGAQPPQSPARLNNIGSSCSCSCSSARAFHLFNPAEKPAPPPPPPPFFSTLFIFPASILLERERNASNTIRHDRHACAIADVIPDR